MCSRLDISSPDAILKLLKKLGVGLQGALATSYNQGPTTPLPVLFTDGTPAAALMTWGLTPGTWKPGSTPKPLINARVETLWERANFRALADSHRCVVMASGFFEWQRSGNNKQPWRFTHPAGEALLMAGVWQHTGGDIDTARQCCIITTAANNLMAPIHHRMPALLDLDDARQWLAGEDRATSEALLRPVPEAMLRAYPVSTYVNNVRNTGPECLAAAETAPQGRLF